MWLLRKLISPLVVAPSISLPIAWLRVGMPFSGLAFLEFTRFFNIHFCIKGPKLNPCLKYRPQENWLHALEGWFLQSTYPQELISAETPVMFRISPTVSPIRNKSYRVFCFQVPRDSAMLRPKRKRMQDVIRNLRRFLFVCGFKCPHYMFSCLLISNQNHKCRPIMYQVMESNHLIRGVLPR